MWTDTRPTVSGYYWMREDGDEPAVVKVSVFRPGWDGEVCFFHGPTCLLSALDGRAEWAGPITAPPPSSAIL